MAFHTRENTRDSSETARPISTDTLLLQEILVTLQKSTIATREAPDSRTRFWSVYKSEADEYDNGLSTAHGSGLDVSLLFSGLFILVCGTFLSTMLVDLRPDPNLTTQALLQTVVLFLNTTGTSGPLLPAAISAPTWEGPSAIVVWTQALLYASMASSLFVALGAVLSKQWSGHYRKVDDVRGTIESRGKDRQYRLENLKTWGFGAVVGSLPFFLQLALFLFSAGLSAFLWNRNKVIGGVFLGLTAAVGFAYLGITVISLIYPDCPFRTPLTTFIESTFRLLRTSLRLAGTSILDASRKFDEALQDAVWIVPSSMQKAIKPLSELKSPLKYVAIAIVALIGLPFIVLNLTAYYVVQFLVLVVKLGYRAVRGSVDLVKVAIHVLGLDKKPLQDGDLLSSQSVSWIMETSDDPLVQTTVGKYMLDIEWSSQLDICPLLDRILDVFLSCFHQDPSLPLQTRVLHPTDRERALSLGMAFLFVYWHGRSNSPGRLISWRTHSDPSRGVKSSYDIGVEIGSWTMTTTERLKTSSPSSDNDNEEIRYVIGLMSETLISHLERDLGRHTTSTHHVLLFAGTTSSPSPSPSLLAIHSRISAIMLHGTLKKTFKLEKYTVEGMLMDTLSLDMNVELGSAVVKDYLVAFSAALDLVAENELEVSDCLLQVLSARVDHIRRYLHPPISPSFFDSTWAQYTSGVLTFLSYCCQKSESLRSKMKKQRVAEWCLEVCESVYNKSLTDATTSSKSDSSTRTAWSSCFFMLALSIMCDRDPKEMIGDPLSALSTGVLYGNLKLDDSAKRALIPHVSWVWKHIHTLQNTLAYEYPVLVSVPVPPPRWMDRIKREDYVSQGYICACWTLGELSKDANNNEEVLTMEGCRVLIEDLSKLPLDVNDYRDFQFTTEIFHSALLLAPQLLLRVVRAGRNGREIEKKKAIDAMLPLTLKSPLSQQERRRRYQHHHSGGEIPSSSSQLETEYMKQYTKAYISFLYSLVSPIPSSSFRGWQISLTGPGEFHYANACFQSLIYVPHPTICPPPTTTTDNNNDKSQLLLPSLSEYSGIARALLNSPNLFNQIPPLTSTTTTTTTPPDNNPNHRWSLSTQRSILTILCLAWRPSPDTKVPLTPTAARQSLTMLERIGEEAVSGLRCCVEKAVWRDGDRDGDGVVELGVGVGVRSGVRAGVVIEGGEGVGEEGNQEEQRRLYGEVQRAFKCALGGSSV